MIDHSKPGGARPMDGLWRTLVESKVRSQVRAAAKTCPPAGGTGTVLRGRDRRHMVTASGSSGGFPQRLPCGLLGVALLFDLALGGSGGIRLRGVPAVPQGLEFLDLLGPSIRQVGLLSRIGG